jgi:multidrug resistance efflux pump
MSPLLYNNGVIVPRYAPRTVFPRRFRCVCSGSALALAFEYGAWQTWRWGYRHKTTSPGFHSRPQLRIARSIAAVIVTVHNAAFQWTHVNEPTGRCAM